MAALHAVHSTDVTRGVALCADLPSDVTRGVALHAARADLPSDVTRGVALRAALSAGVRHRAALGASQLRARGGGGA